MLVTEAANSQVLLILIGVVVLLSQLSIFLMWEIDTGSFVYF